MSNMLFQIIFQAIQGEHHVFQIICEAATLKALSLSVPGVFTKNIKNKVSNILLNIWNIILLFFSPDKLFSECTGRGSFVFFFHIEEEFEFVDLKESLLGNFQLKTEYSLFTLRISNRYLSV